MLRNPNKVAAPCQAFAGARTMAAASLVLAVWLCALSLQPAFAAERVAVLGIELLKDDLTPGGGRLTPRDEARVKKTAAMLRELLAGADFEVVSAARTEAVLAADPPGQYLHACNGCELDYGRALDADWVLVGWVQQVSNLILNLNVLVKDVDTGALVASGFVDLRGNTDESWTRATRYLWDNLLLGRLEAKR